MIKVVIDVWINCWYIEDGRFRGCTGVGKDFFRGGNLFWDLMYEEYVLGKWSSFYKVWVKSSLGCF